MCVRASWHEYKGRSTPSFPPWGSFFFSARFDPVNFPYSLVGTLIKTCSPLFSLRPRFFLSPCLVCQSAKIPPPFACALQPSLPLSHSTFFSSGILCDFCFLFIFFSSRRRDGNGICSKDTTVAKRCQHLTNRIFFRYHVTGESLLPRGDDRAFITCVADRPACSDCPSPPFTQGKNACYFFSFLRRVTVTWGALFPVSHRE